MKWYTLQSQAGPDQPGAHLRKMAIGKKYFWHIAPREKYLAKKIPATSRHVKTSFAIFLLALSTFAVTPTTAQVPRWRSEEWSGWSELKSETSKIWKCQLSDEQEVKYEMKRKKPKKNLKVLPVAWCVVALAEFPGDGLRRVTSAPAALTRTSTRADRSTWWRVGRSGEKEREKSLHR